MSSKPATMAMTTTATIASTPVKTRAVAMASSTPTSKLAMMETSFEAMAATTVASRLDGPDPWPVLQAWSLPSAAMASSRVANNVMTATRTQEMAATTVLLKLDGPVNLRSVNPSVVTI